MSSRLVLENGREDGKIACTWFGGFLLGARLKCKKMGWASYRKKNFFILNDSVGLSMCDCLIETVKYIWVNIWCMLDWILSQNCRNTLPLHTAVEQLGVQKLKTLLCLTNCWQPTSTSLLTRQKILKIQVWLWFCIVWTVFNTRTTWYFQYYMYRLGKPNAVCFPPFHNGCNPACKVWCRLQTGE